MIQSSSWHDSSVICLWWGACRLPWYCRSMVTTYTDLYTCNFPSGPAWCASTMRTRSHFMGCIKCLLWRQTMSPTLSFRYVLSKLAISMYNDFNLQLEQINRLPQWDQLEASISPGYIPVESIPCSSKLPPIIYCWFSCYVGQLADETTHDMHT